ncbi:hypothetical protein GCK32_005130, partial [Trichostrongylus colubriformis]
ATVHGCFPTNERQAQFGAQTAQFQQPPPAPQSQGVVLQPTFQAARVAAAGRAPTVPIAAKSHAIALSAISVGLGDHVTLTEFGADGYNAEGGGPVNSGNALTCKFDGRPCCWANVPPPDDQLDWHVGTGAPNSTVFRNAPAPGKKYTLIDLYWTCEDFYALLLT